MKVEMENIGGSFEGKNLPVDQYLKRYKKMGNHVKRFIFSKKYSKGKKILDYGCGYGIGASLLEDSYSRYVGIDIDPSAIEYGNKNFSLGEKINFYPISKIRENGLRETFDVGLCFEVLEHVKDPFELLDTLSKLIVKGGVLIISTPNGKSSNGNKRLYRTSYHIKEYGPKEFHEILSHFGDVELFGERRIDRLDLVHLRRRLNCRDLNEIKNYAIQVPEPSKSKLFELAYILINDSIFWKIYRTSVQYEETDINSSTLIGLIRMP